MKTIKILLGAVLCCALFTTAKAQSNTNSPTSALDFPATAAGWLSSIDYTKAWPTNEIDISVGALWDNNVSWCNYLGLQKNIGNFTLGGEMDNAGVAGTIYRAQAIVGYRLLNRGDLSAQVTLGGGYDRINKSAFAEPAVTLRKQMAHGAFAEVSLRYDVLAKGQQPSAATLGIGTGWTF